MTTNPAVLFREFARKLGIEDHERRLLLLMGALVATLFCAYTLAKVLRDALFLSEFGALALPYAYIGVAVAAAGFVWLDSMVARRVSRIGATRLSQYAAIGFSLAGALVLPHARHWAIVGFYIWTGSQAMMLLPHFWALALDVWDSRRARSVFPLLGGCALVGGLAGGAFAAWAAPTLKQAGLMWALSGLLLGTLVLTRLVETYRARRPDPLEAGSSTSTWEIIRRSGYIKVLAGALALSVIVSTLVDFQFKVFVRHLYPDPHSLTKFFGEFYVGLNALSLLFQFSVAGLVMRRLGLGPSIALQPATAVLFTALLTLGPVAWAVIALRWVQGVVFQTLGKSSSEICYAAIHPRERRRIKPVIDTLVDRWADAAVGVLLIVLLHTVGVGTYVVAGVTLALAAAWGAVIFFLNRQYGRAFEQTLSSRWIEPEETPDAVRTPSARKALLLALRADDERRIVLALKLSRVARDAAIASAVRDCLQHSSPAVRAAAVQSMQAMRLVDPNGAITAMLAQPHEAVRRAAVGYLLAVGPDGTSFARRLLDGDDATLRQYVLDSLFERPFDAPNAVTPEWIDARIRSAAPDDLLVAARAAGAMSGPAAAPRLRALLAMPDADVRHVALLSARRRPNPALIDLLIPLLLLPEHSLEAREAIAAIGNPAVPALADLLGGAQGPRAQVLAARTLGRLATPRAMGALMKLVRTADPRLRYLGLQNMRIVRVETGRPVLPRAAAHKLFLRELAAYRVNIEPATRLEAHPAAEIRLLSASFRESAEMALERGLSALASWYEPKPLAGAFDRLRSREPQAAAPALEYLGHVLPRPIFRPVSRIFEGSAAIPETEAGAEARDDVADSIRSAWRLGDEWLRACAVRASRHTQSLDAEFFATGGGEEPIVKAEIAWLLAPAPAGASAQPSGADGTARRTAAC